jgi:hypothetical protein
MPMVQDISIALGNADSSDKYAHNTRVCLVLNKLVCFARSDDDELK